jgi:serine/threonine protein kinase
MRHCLEALSASHDMGVIHRDLKLENLLVSGEEDVKLADFGVASCRDVSSGATGNGMIVGTPSYMAPEQAMGGQADPRSDLYSVGVMLFELLTGRLPFEDPNPLNLLEMQVKKEPILVNRLNPALGVS